MTDHELEKLALTQRTNVPLVNGLSLIILTITAVVALWLVSPRSNMLLDLIARSSSPEIALAFLSALDQDTAQQNRIRLLMIKNHLILNQLDETESIILPMMQNRNGFTSATEKEEAYQYYIDLLLARYNGEDNKQKKLASQKISDFFRSIKSTKSYTTARKFANVAIGFGMPDKAYQFLAPFLSSGLVSDKELLELALQHENYSAAVQHQGNVFNRTQSIIALRELIKITRLSGQPAIPLDFFKQYRGGLENHPEYLLLAIRSALTHGDYEYATSLYQRIESVEYSDEQLLSISTTAIQVGKLDFAQQSLTALVNRTPNIHNMTKLHDLFLWQSDIANALAMTNNIINFSQKNSIPSERLIRQGIREAQAIGDMPLQGKFYSMLAVHDYLSKGELSQYIDINEKVFGSLSALKEIERLAKLDQGNELLTFHKLRILGYLSRYQAITNLWSEHKSHLKISPNQAVMISDAFQKLNQSKYALTVLTSLADWQQQNIEYLEQVFSLAWNLGEKELAITAQTALMNHETFDSSSPQNIFRYVQLHQPFKLEDIEQLVFLYRKWDKERLLLMALDISAKYEDKSKFIELLEMAKQDPRLANHPSVLNHVFLYAINTKNTADVEEYFAKLLKLTPNSPSLISTYLWWHMDNGQLEKLEHSYALFKLQLIDSLHLPQDTEKPISEQDLSTLMALAASGHRLGLLGEADVFYRKLFQYQIPKANSFAYLQLILNYAQLLDLKGDSPTAYQLRQYVIENLADILVETNGKTLSFVSLVDIFSGSKNARILSQWQTINDPNDMLVTDLYGRYIAHQQFDNLYFWNDRNEFSNYKIPNWEQLAIAIKKKDKLKIKQLLDESLGLPSADENFALQMLGLYQKAWKHGETILARLDDKTAEKQLRFIHVGQHAIKSHGYGVKYKSFSKWDIERASLFYYQPSDKGQWRIDAMGQNADTANLLQNFHSKKERRLQIQYREKYASSTEDTAYRWSAKLDLADGFGELRTGLSAELEFSIDDYWQSRIKIGFANAFEASQLSTLASKDNLLGISADYSPTKREHLTLSFNYHDLDNRYGDEIGQGWDASLRISEKLFFADPAWEVYSAINIQRFNLNSNPLIKVNQVLQLLDSRLIVSNDFIDEEYAHISIGQRLSHGTPMLEGAMLPSPRYWLDTAMGYNNTNKRMDFSVSSGFGWRILGDDELSFSLDWQSQDVNGDASLQISLGYYYNL
ncbi:MAG: tetratricopeptide repeat protein [Kangiellaceae bacterium]|nr:tetratricopeptide repeat protein [Kangiellaceae bacterium]